MTNFRKWSSQRKNNHSEATLWPPEVVVRRLRQVFWRCSLRRSITLFFVFSLLAFHAFAGSQKYVLTKLVSDQTRQALIQDPGLVNPWGIAFSPTAGAFWVSDNAAGKATLYTGDVNGSAVQQAQLVVTIPGGVQTGVVFNGTNDFVVTNGQQSGPARFIFVSEAGTISGWNPNVPPNTDAKPATAVPGAIFKGVTLASNGTGNFLYVADFHNHQIDVFDKTFTLVALDGTFTDPEIPDNFAPFNIQNLNGNLYVTYALADDASEDEVAGDHRGFVSVFDTDGHLVKHLVARGRLNAPWGLALAPADFGPFSNALLVGNFGDGRIHAYDATTGAFLGRLKTQPHPKLNGLWALTFGNGISAGDKNTLYFTAGPDDETHGLFGKIAFDKGL